MNAKHIFLLGILISCLSIQDSIAQVEHRKQTKEQIKSYVQREVLPVMTQQRQALDLLLSEEDKLAVETLREEQHTLRKKMKDQRPSKESFKQGERPSEEQRAIFRQHMKERRQLMTQAWEIADKYETEIDQLLTAIAPQTDTWREDIRAMIPDAQKEGKGSDRTHAKRKGHGHAPHGMRKARRGGPMRLLRQMHSPVGFLLWDPARTPGELASEAEHNQLTIFPNPTQRQTTLTYSLETVGPVHIEILDQQGNVIKTINRPAQDAGVHSESIGTDDLKEGAYILRLQSNKQVLSSKLIIK